MKDKFDNETEEFNWYNEVDKGSDEQPQMLLPKELEVSSQCVDIVEFYEGFRENAYKDPVGIWTLGHGFTHDVSPGDTITYEESKQRLLKELDYFADYVRIHTKVPLTQNMFDSLTCFVFNVGGGNYANSTLKKKLNQEDYESAAKEFTKWVYAGGEKLAGLVKRRESEMKMFLGEDWQDV